jgi:hypothetical protein
MPKVHQVCDRGQLTGLFSRGTKALRLAPVGLPISCAAISESSVCNGVEEEGLITSKSNLGSIRYPRIDVSVLGANLRLYPKNPGKRRFPKTLKSVPSSEVPISRVLIFQTFVSP